MQKNTTNFYNKTIWIDKKTIISANLLNKIEDKLLDLDINLANKAELNDTEVKKDATWSSDKISTWSMEQDGIFWTRKEDKFLSVSNTYEYNLKEMEIFGHTWQDNKDSKNLFDGKLEPGNYMNGIGSVNQTDYKSVNKIYVKPETMYSIYQEDDTNFLRLHAYKHDGTYIQYVAGGNVKQFTTPAECAYIHFHVPKGDNLTLQTKISIVEGNIKPTEYIPYHRADLSNIQHVGELYTDEKGRPILDEHNKEQYKIEIESSNDNLIVLDNASNRDKITIDSLNTFTYNSKVNYWPSGAVNFKIPCKPETRYTMGAIFDNFEYGGKNNRITIRDKDNGIEYACANNSTKSITTGKDSNYLTITYYPIYGVPNPYPIENIVTKVKLYLEEEKSCQFLDKIAHKQTIILPCQLMKVGDIQDRLFWDESKRRYIVEKNVLKLTKKELGEHDSTRIYGTQWCLQWLDIDQKFGLKSQCYNAISNLIQYEINYKQISQQYWAGSFRVFVNHRLIKPESTQASDISKNEFEEFINNNDVFNDGCVIIPLLKPQLIETNTITPLCLPTHNNKTHIYVISKNNTKATIKAKFPLKTAETISILSSENAKNTKDILDIKELNIDMIATNFDMDYRLLELEWALEDAGVVRLNLLNILNIDKKNNNKTLTRYEQAKIIITKQAYEYEILAKQLSRYLEKDIITQDEYNELIALMEENE